MSTPHPPRCWEAPGHERCALTYAALRAQQQAEHAAATAALYRAQAHTGTPDPELVARAVRQLADRRSVAPIELSGIPRGDHHSCKVTDAQVAESRAIYRRHHAALIRTLASHFGVTRQCMHLIVTGRRRAAPLTAGCTPTHTPAQEAA